ncbi:hypothetical protein BO82DRAFT_397547 [Aspergillus uvarum CBS 121591]|uniref:Uncharacterized protein n=1 Tax=Aspergillus uvarum CBS 121591 TaxID=1448315 RepID=A0A319CQF2_9EURO|nr:hypothetical protein BO82DRAFT_397547 [Aspergillus uvarum CBS 121591]PYH86371.1 hypothetical protein BO82DRAFT_397547 [Aspergillus uvarum CBS 121591]
MHDSSSNILDQSSQHYDLVLPVVCSHDSNLLASASSDQTVKLWDAGRGACVLKLLKQFKVTAAQDLRLIPQWPDQLGAYFAREGLTAVETHRVQAAATAPHLEFAMHQCNLLMYEMIASRAAEGSRAQQIRTLIPRVVGESKRGAMYVMHRVVVGQKKP